MKKAIVVLGMHRSGTSSIAGTLVALGAQAPKTLMPQHPKDNPKGYFESLTLMKLNDKLLAAAGSSWKDPQAFPANWHHTDQGQKHITTLAQAIQDEFAAAPLIVLKDPRICRLFPLWKEALRIAGYQPQILMPLRHPLEVAASLAKREKFTQAEGLLLWLRHVIDAEKDTRNEDRVVILWEDFIQDWKKVVEGLNDRLGLSLWPTTAERIAQADSHMDPGLRRNNAREIPAGSGFELVRAPYEALKALAASPYDAQVLNRLDTLAREFELGLRYMIPVTGELRQALEQDVRRERQKYEGCKADLAAEIDRVSRRNASIQTLRAQLKEYRREVQPSTTQSS